MIHRQRAQAAQLLAAARAPGTAVQAVGHDVAVTGVLVAHRAIDHHHPTMQVGNRRHQ
ncbi:hypothetical protein SDC9_160449 [bioreactor metagenome]|uniref:Uncharacterized protein n=1 Tax=bioreactor metagenome TaxID=1076179 RepID=A0A645FIF7_9ZZZZ